jgi:type I restriction-modification system DNA methylase subunit
MDSIQQFFKFSLNYLRDNEGLTGEKALRNTTYFLILKLIEKHVGTLLNFEDFNDFDSYFEADVLENNRKKLLHFIKFSNLASENEINLSTIISLLWETMLSVHPSTKNIFLKEKKFDIKKANTFKAIIDKLQTYDFSLITFDILGAAYEEVVKDIMTGKVLGQFFTQPLLKKLMVNLIDPQVKSNGEIETCCDPTMGTGGFLISYMNAISEKANKQNIDLNWNFIKTKGLFGKELESDTYQLAVSNLLISTGYFFENLQNGDSIRSPIKEKFDNVLANPPFGINGLKYEDFAFENKDEYLPIKSDNAVSLFLQVIIHILKINGKCAVVLPYGEDIYSIRNKSMIAVREFLLRTCDLKEVIYLPSGIFTNTKIRTCVFFFIKKRDGLEVITKGKKANDYIFCDSFETKNIDFFETNINSENDLEKKLLGSLSIDVISKKYFSLKYLDYFEENVIVYEDGIETKTMKEICNFLPKSKRNAKFGKEKGSFPFFKSSLAITSFVDEPDYNKESLIIGDGGDANVNYADFFSASDHCYIIQNKDETKVVLKYIYYYLFNNLNVLAAFYSGVGIKNIAKSSIESIKIPLPSFEKQNEIVKKCEENDKKCKDYQFEIEKLKKQNADFFNFVVN